MDTTNWTKTHFTDKRAHLHRHVYSWYQGTTGVSGIRKGNSTRKMFDHFLLWIGEKKKAEVATYIAYLIEKVRDFVYRRFLKRDRHSSHQSQLDSSRVSLRTMDEDISDLEFTWRMFLFIIQYKYVSKSVKLLFFVVECSQNLIYSIYSDSRGRNFLFLQFTVLLFWSIRWHVTLGAFDYFIFKVDCSGEHNFSWNECFFFFSHTFATFQNKSETNRTNTSDKKGFGWGTKGVFVPTVWVLQNEMGDCSKRETSQPSFNSRALVWFEKRS